MEPERSSEGAIVMWALRKMASSGLVRPARGRMSARLLVWIDLIIQRKI